MQQLFFIKKEKLEWREVADPKIEQGVEALVRPFAVAKCDLDDAFLFNNIKLKVKIGKLLNVLDPANFSRFGNLLMGPFPFGHECVAEVTHVGDQVKNIKVGDVVSVPFQLSCGHCQNCQSGITSCCSSVPALSMYGFGKYLQYGGAMSDIIKVPFADAMLLKIPNNINPIHLASLSDNVPDAYRHVGPWLEEDVNKSILIVGGRAQSVGLYTALIALALGAKQVDYVDNNHTRLALAKNIGVHKTIESLSDVKEKYDVVVDANSTPKGLYAAIKSTKNFGVCSSSGIYMKKTTMPLIDMYANGITFKIGLANARTDAEKVLDLISSGKLKLESVTTKLDSWDNSIDAFLSKSAKVIVTRERIKQNK